MELPSDLLALYEIYDEDVVATLEDEVTALLDDGQVDRAAGVIVGGAYARLLNEEKSMEITEHAMAFADRLEANWEAYEEIAARSPDDDELTQLAVTTILTAQHLIADEELTLDFDELIDQLSQLLREDEGLSRGIFDFLLRIALYADLPRAQLAETLERLEEELVEYFQARMYSGLRMALGQNAELSDELREMLLGE